MATVKRYVAFYHTLLTLNGSRRNARDLNSETSKGSKTRLYQICTHHRQPVSNSSTRKITRSKMGLET